MRVYIIGSKGIPAKYGGFETFADQLVSGSNKGIEYVVTGMSKKNEQYNYMGARCIQLKTINSALGRTFHMIKAFLFVLKDSKTTPKSIVYILGCRAGIFLPFFRPFLKSRNIKILVNPDGAEWKRAKWNFVAKKVVMLFEVLLIKFADIVVCDAVAILDLLHVDFRVPKNKMVFIAYGAEVYDEPKKLPVKLKMNYELWLKAHNLNDHNFYLMVGRFVPENNFELIIREFMASSTKADLVIVSNVEHNGYYDSLVANTGLNTDSRIKLVGTLYDQSLLKVVRSHARAYIHGHEVGGTNPSLLEALGSTNVNLVYDVSFNREVARDGAFFFNSKPRNLAKLIERTDIITDSQSNTLGVKAKKHIADNYNWRNIIKEYEELFLVGDVGNENSTL